MRSSLPEGDSRTGFPPAGLPLFQFPIALNITGIFLLITAPAFANPCGIWLTRGLLLDFLRPR